jgi:hypothetical protein
MRAAPAAPSHQGDAAGATSTPGAGRAAMPRPVDYAMLRRILYADSSLRRRRSAAPRLHYLSACRLRAAPSQHLLARRESVGPGSRGPARTLAAPRRSGNRELSVGVPGCFRGGGDEMHHVSHKRTTTPAISGRVPRVAAAPRQRRPGRSGRAGRWRQGLDAALARGSRLNTRYTALWPSAVGVQKRPGREGAPDV